MTLDDLQVKVVHAVVSVEAEAVHAVVMVAELLEGIHVMRIEAETAVVHVVVTVVQAEIAIHKVEL